MYGMWVPQFFNLKNVDWTDTCTPRKPKLPWIGSKGVIRQVYIIRGEECPV